MKKLFLCGSALAGLMLASAPASADGLNMQVGGFFRGYGVYTDHDDNFVATGASDNLRKFDLRRQTEIHFSGETTTDNGLTVGAHTELKTSDDTTANSIDETYAYFSGSWGRVNLGSEDGAAYLLQVAAPSGDSNIDGMRTYIQTFNTFGELVDYQHADFKDTDRLTYLTPKFNGFQAGVSYAPEMGQNAIGNNVAAMAADDDNDQYEDLWEASARWDGEFEGFGLSIGGGFSNADLEADAGFYTNDITTWNVGGNVTFSGFSFGVAYLDREIGEDLTSLGGANADVNQRTWVAGLGWDNGPYHVGASYLDTKWDQDGVPNTDVKAKKASIGGGYTFAPGMSFRGSVTQLSVNAKDLGGTSENATQFALGTDIAF